MSTHKIKTSELDDEDEFFITMNLTEAGEEKVSAWSDEVAKPGVDRDTVILEVFLHIWEFYPEVPAYELGARFTRTGRPEILHLVEGEDYQVEVGA